MKIVSTNLVKDLGYFLSSDLDSHTHCVNVCKKANFLLRNLKICFTYHNTHFYISLYITFVRPILEYNTVIFFPQTIQDIDLIESVQRRFTKYLPNMVNQSYHDRLAALNIESLECRRIQFDVILVYKAFHNLIDINFDDYFILCNNNTRGHQYKIYVNYS